MPDVADRSEPSRSVRTQGRRPGHLHLSRHRLGQRHVNSASEPSATFDAGPVMLNSALSLSSGASVVVLSSSVNVTVAEVTDSPETVVVPGMVIVSSPSTT